MSLRERSGEGVEVAAPRKRLLQLGRSIVHNKLVSDEELGQQSVADNSAGGRVGQSSKVVAVKLSVFGLLKDVGQQREQLVKLNSGGVGHGARNE